MTAIPGQAGRSAFVAAQPVGWRIAVAALRIHVGLTWLWYAWPKFARADGFLPPSGYMVSFLDTSAKYATGLTRSVLEQVILPHAFFWAELARFGELTAGLLLLLGLFSRLGGSVGVAVALGYASFNYAFHGYHSGLLTLPDSMMAALSAVHVILPSGTALGLDALRRYGHGIVELQPASAGAGQS